MNLIGEYKNGNYDVSIYDDGTKIRENNLNFFVPAFPESMDVKITNKCNMGCAFCHENSLPDGEHGDILQSAFIDTLSPFTELAIGGGNPLCHPDLIPFLEKLKARNILANITVNQSHFVYNQATIRFLVSEKLIHGLGVSLTHASPNLVSLLQHYSNAVLHVIAGIVTKSELQKLYDKNLKVLILGYKLFGRGESFYSPEVDDNMNMMYRNLWDILNRFSVVSFDNLAIKQLKVKRFLSGEEWSEFYMGDDGQYTMYIDMVKGEFAKSSTSVTRYKILPNIVDMFNIVRGE